MGVVRRSVAQRCSAIFVLYGLNESGPRVNRDERGFHSGAGYGNCNDDVINSLLIESVSSRHLAGRG
jgi:hypothetical protein